MNRDLTFDEKITAAYLHFVRDIEMQDIAVAYDVNIGRVSEACAATKRALADDRLTILNNIANRGSS